MPRTYFAPFGTQYANDPEPTGSNAGRFPLGQYLQLPDGRLFRYALVGGTATAAGKLYQAVAPVAHHTNVACDVARAVGATAISATLGATAAAIDIYSEGIVHTNDATGEGYAYRIRRAIQEGQAHAAAAASAVLTVNLEPGESVQVALVASTSEVTFTRNRFHSVIIHPSPPTAQLAGVAPCAITASYYGYLQVRGPAAVLANGTVVVGDEVIPSDAVDGAVEPRNYVLTEGTPNTMDGTQEMPAVGVAITANADTEYTLVNLQLE